MTTHANAEHAELPEAPWHHGSWAPIILALGIVFLGLSLLFPLYALPVGVLIAGVGLAWWIREDVVRFRQVANLPAPKHPGPYLGMWLFIGSEVLIFGSLFAIWFVGKYDLGAAFQPGDVHLPVSVALINTALLVSSGGALHWSMQRLKHDHRNAFLGGFALTLLLGAAFLFLQVREYVNLIAEGFTIQSELFGAIFYGLTGTHGLHVAGGLAFLGIVFLRSLAGTQTKRHHLVLETAAMYWHFVDVVWIFLVAVVYLQWV